MNQLKSRTASPTQDLAIGSGGETSPETTRQNAQREINQISPWKAVTSKWQQVGHGIESTETQVAILFVIYLDLVISCLLVALTSAEVGGGTSLIALFSNSLTVRVLHTVTSLTLLVTVGELAVLMLTFGIKTFLSHAGYALDSVIASVFVCHEIHYVKDYDEVAYLVGGNTFRLLGVLRLSWRVIRIVAALVKGASKEHTIELQRLQNQIGGEAQLKLELEIAQRTANRESEARRSLDTLLQEYKEEINILEEALRIAANDVLSGALDVIAKEEIPFDQPIFETIVADKDGDVFFDDAVEHSEAGDGQD